MISKTLSTSVCFARLFDRYAPIAEFAQSLYPLLVAHADDFGREQGDVLTVKYRIHPRSPRTEDDFGLAMAALEDVGLIAWYELRGRQCYQIVKFDEHQSGLHKRTRSQFPPPPGNSGKVTGVPAQLKGTELNLTELNGTKQKQPTAADAAFDRFWENYPRKVAKPNALKAFRKIAPDDTLLGAMLAAIAVQSQSPSWLKDGGAFIPHPATWLNGRRWEDEQPAPVRPRTLGPLPRQAAWEIVCERDHDCACPGERAHAERMAREKAVAS